MNVRQEHRKLLPEELHVLVPATARVRVLEEQLNVARAHLKELAAIAAADAPPGSVIDLGSKAILLPEPIGKRRRGKPCQK